MNFWIGVLIGWAICTPLTVFIIAFFISASAHNDWDED